MKISRIKDVYIFLFKEFPLHEISRHPTELYSLMNPPCTDIELIEFLDNGTIEEQAACCGWICGSGMHDL
jgi:hypothetical protein